MGLLSLLLMMIGERLFVRVLQNCCFLVNLKATLSSLQNIGVLLDLDGVVYKGDSLIAGAAKMKKDEFSIKNP